MWTVSSAPLPVSENLFGFFNWSSLLLDGTSQRVPSKPVF